MDKKLDFIEKVANACIKHKEYGILPSLTIAQACVEGISTKIFLFSTLSFIMS